MNTTCINGFLQGYAKYVTNPETSRKEVIFVVSTYNSRKKKSVPIPCKIVSDVTKAIASLVANSYLEISGELDFENGRLFLVVKDISIKPPKEKDEIYIKSEDFYATYSPKKIIDLDDG